MHPPLESFSPEVAGWFAAAYGDPTPPQSEGWPAIQRGENTLILAPTGSGKTLAAFLWGIDELVRELRAAPTGSSSQPPLGIRLVYVSPLKALNNDIHRNLRVPLAGIRDEARRLGADFPEIRVAVRSGDTPASERQRLVKKPPHILITTPESLYLILTSPRAREMFATTRTVILDEIHTLVGSKRGVHLALSVERLERAAGRALQRIGLSATIRPLDEGARFLGGGEWQGQGAARAASASRDPAGASTEDDATVEDAVLVPRPVTVVDAGFRKPLDLRVETVVEDFRDLPGGSVWPSIIPRVVDLIRGHRTTLVFVNNRRLAERTADRLNEQLAAEARGESLGLVVDGVAKGAGFAAAGRGSPRAQAGIEPIRAHHGSMAREARLDMEQGLKEGRLRALVGTSSLELGIDIGSVDLIVQLQSPKAVSQGLQRVGRSGHLVGQTSKGRLFPTHREDLMEAAVVAGGMLRGEVEALRTPVNVLDVLAQQIVAMVSVEDWSVSELYRLVRRAYPYQRLTERAFRAVLDMLAGRYPSEVHRELRPRVSWDRVNDRLAALPGARLLAVTNGGTIPDRGTYGAYLPDGRTRIGELDEEFVFETRPGDTFMLGSQVWRVLDITQDRVLVKEAPGALARMPFWHGDYPWRPYELGKRVGAFRRGLAERLTALAARYGLQGPGDLVLALGPDPRAALEPEPPAALPPESGAALTPQVGAALSPEVRAALEAEMRALQEEHALDQGSARGVLAYVAEMLDRAGAISTDRTILVESFEDAVGDPRLVVHSPFGGRVNGPWGLALADALRERTGIEVEVQSGDEGILLRFASAETELPLDLVGALGPEEARERILRTLPDSAVFGPQFRMNAARALLLPGGRPGRRTPFWLQRLRAKDLLQAVRRFPEFPVVAETFRDCLEDVMDLPHLEEVLTGIRRGEIRVVPVESAIPTPVALGLLWSFTNIYLYEWDTPKAERQLQTLTVSRELLQDLLRDVALDELLRPEALREVTGRLSRTAPEARARTAEELAAVLDQQGDLTDEELGARSAGNAKTWMSSLAAAGRVARFEVPAAGGAEPRWVPVEFLPDYQAAFGPGEGSEIPAGREAAAAEPARADREQAARRILERFLLSAGPVTEAEIRERYLFPEDWLHQELERLVQERRLAHGRFNPQPTAGSPQRETGPRPDEYLELRALEQVHRRTLSVLRREVRPVSFPAYADFLARWQHVHPAERLSGRGGLRLVLQQLRAVPAPGTVWERDLVPLRLTRYRPQELEELFQEGELVWVATGSGDLRRARVRLLFRGEGEAFLGPPAVDPDSLSAGARELHGFLKDEGAVFYADIRAGLGLEDAEARALLAELVAAGLVTSDSLAALRDLLGGAAPAPPRHSSTASRSSLEEELTRRLGDRPARGHGWHRPSRGAYRAASRRVRERLQAGTGPPRAGLRAGRWSLVHRVGVLGRSLPPEERALRQARQLLLRSGVVTRASLEREEGPWEWPAVFAELQRLEMRGEVRRGYFVAGLPGVQFALPEAVERLRAVAADLGEERDTAAELVVLNAVDPALVRVPEAVEGENLPFLRIPSTWVVLHRGLPVLVAEDTAARISTRPGIPENLPRLALGALLEHLGTFLARITIETWDGEPVLESAAPPLLETLGFYRDHPGMSWERAPGPLTPSETAPPPAR